jgi:hypothetical protein
MKSYNPLLFPNQSDNLNKINKMVKKTQFQSIKILFIN